MREYIVSIYINVYKHVGSHLPRIVSKSFQMQDERVGHEVDSGRQLHTAAVALAVLAVQLPDLGCKETC